MSTKSLVVRFIGDTKDLGKNIDDLNGKFSGVGKAITGIAAAGAALGVVSFFKTAIDEAREAAKVTRQTEAVLKSTGGVANVTAKQIDTLATALSNKAGIDDEIIASGANVLLTFTKVRNEVGKGNDIFNQGTSIALDMSAALGTDLQASVIQVGKALNDPIKGVTALQKVGVSFTAAQKDEIKALTAKGDLLGAQKLILGELNTEFGGMAAASADAGAKMKVAFGNMAESVGNMILPIFTWLANWITNKVIPAASTLAATVGTWLEPVLMSAGAAIRDTVVPALKDAYEWLMNNKIVLAAMAGSVAGILAMATALKIATVAMFLFNLVTKANPIMIIVSLIGALVGAFIYAYQNSETFRNIVQAVFAAVQLAVSNAITFIRPFLDGFMNVLQFIGEKAMWLWATIISPVFGMIGQYVGLVWDSFLKPVLTTFGELLVKLGAILLDVWTSVIQPVFGFIGMVVKALWDNFIGPVFGLIFAILGVFAQLIFETWNAVVFPILTLIGGLFKWLWENAIGPALNGIANVITWLWHTIVKPAFEAIGAIIKWVWDNVIFPTFETLKRGIDGVREGFQTGSSAIEKIWNGLKAIAAAPVNFIIGTVFNNGIRKVWNWIASKIGLPQLDEVPLIKFAGGGRVRGPGGPKDDKVIAALSNDEFVLPADKYKKYKGLVHAMWQGTLPGFAGGGPITPKPGTAGTPPADGGGAPDWLKFIGGFFTNPVNAVKGLFGGVLNGLDKFRGTDLGKAITDIPGKALDSVFTFLKDKVTGFFSGGSGWGANLGAFVTGAAGGAQQWAPLVLQVLAMLGQPASLLPNVLRRMNQESGGNPNAINNWDSNAAKGTPSIGLMQTIGPTFAAYAGPFAGRGIRDPLANIYAGVNYAIHRYPSLQYAMDKPGGYINGGILPPGQLGFNETKKPEYILNESQWDAMKNSGGNTYILNVYANEFTSTDLEQGFASMERMAAPT